MQVQLILSKIVICLYDIINKYPDSAVLSMLENNRTLLRLIISVHALYVSINVCIYKYFIIIFITLLMLNP